MFFMQGTPPGFLYYFCWYFLGKPIAFTLTSIEFIAEKNTTRSQPPGFLATNIRNLQVFIRSGWDVY